MSSARPRPTGRRRGLAGLGAVAAVTALALSACAGTGSTEQSEKEVEAKIDVPDISSDLTPMQQAEKYDEVVGKASEDYKIAVFNTCTDVNAWCQAMYQYQTESADKYGVDVQSFDAAFDPEKQLRQVQDAIAKGGYDGFVLQPVTAAAGCQMMKLLQGTGLPVQGANSPVCEDEDYHEGATGMVSTSTVTYYKDYLATVFDSCGGDPCKAMVIGGVAGQDGWRRLQQAIEETLEDYPNVDVVVEQPGEYDPNTALQITQDGLAAHPDISLILSAYDEMSRGIIKGVESSGRAFGDDLRLYSIGGTPYGLDQVKNGTIVSTIQSDPYPEGYFSLVELVRYLDTGVKTEGWSSTNEWSGITGGPGSPVLTKDNVDQYTPTYG
jgi:galactofuranose transport system substrate-binding protein